MKREAQSSQDYEGTRKPKRPKSEEAPNWDLFGETPRYVAAGLRVRPELVLSYFSSTLGGLAGNFARLEGFLGEQHHPALPLVLAERHPSKARSLFQLATGPALHYSDWERRKSQALDPELFKMHHGQMGASVRQTNLRLLEELDNSFGNQDVIAAERTALLRHRQNHQPSVLLASPDPKSFDQLLGSVLDEHPLIVDSGGRIIRNAIQPHPRQKEWQDLLERIIEGARDGIDQMAGDGSPETLDRARRMRTPFLFHLPHELTGQTLFHPASANLYEVAMVVPTEEIQGSLIWSDENFDTARRVVGKYRDALNEALWSRRDSSSVFYSAKKPILELIKGQDELHDRIDSLPLEVRRYCGGLIDLPLRLLWTALLLDDRRGQNVPQFVPGVLQTARWCVDRHVELVTESLEAERRRELEDAARVMLRKLGEISDLPCRFAELARKYPIQRKDLLEPALNFLAEEGLASWNPERNRIDLLECDSPPEWVTNRQSGNSDLFTLPSRSPDAR